MMYQVSIIQRVSPSRMDLLRRVVWLLRLVEVAAGILQVVAAVGVVLDAHGGGRLRRLHHGQDLGEALAVLYRSGSRVIELVIRDGDFAPFQNN